MPCMETICVFLLVIRAECLRRQTPHEIPSCQVFRHEPLLYTGTGTFGVDHPPDLTQPDDQTLVWGKNRAITARRTYCNKFERQSWCVGHHKSLVSLHSQLVDAVVQQIATVVWGFRVQVKERVVIASVHCGHHLHGVKDSRVT